MSAFLPNLEFVFGWLLAASWQASVLALVVVAIQGMFGARLNPRWRYALWLLVVLRLVLPVLPESALSLFQFAPPPPAALTVSVTEPLFVAAPILPPVAVPVTVPRPVHPLSFYSLLAIAWLTGALGLLLLTLIVNRRFARQVANSPAITDPELLRLFSEAKAEFRIRREIRLVENSQVQSPAIMGLFHPTLLLPVNVRENFDARELRFIFLHELAHLKRGDVIIQTLIALLQILHWFNPVLWFAFRRMRIDREPATDALVLSRTGEDEKERYGLMLIKLLEHFNQRHSLATLVGILEDKDQFKRRFSLIARFTRGAYGWSLLGVIILTVLSIAFLTNARISSSMSESEAQAKDIAALVNNRPVYWSEIAYYLPTSPADLSLQTSRDLLQKESTEVRFGRVQAEVDRQLAIQSFDPARDSFRPTRVQEAVDFAVKGFGGDQAALEKNLKKNGGSLEQFTERRREDEIFAHVDDLMVEQPARKYMQELSPTHAEYRGSTDKATLELYYAEARKLAAKWMQDLEAHATIQFFGDLKDFAQMHKVQSARGETTDQQFSRLSFLAALKKGDAVALQKLIDQGVEIPKMDDKSDPLIFFARTAAVAEILLNHGADANARNKQNQPAINFFCRNGGSEAAVIVEVLLKHGANPNSREGEIGETPLMAAQDGKTVEVLFTHGADPTIKRTDGVGLMGCTGVQRLDYFEALLKHGVAFDPKTDGPAILLQASLRGNVPVIKAMFDRGVDPNQDAVFAKVNGKPVMMKPLPLSVMDGRVEAIKLLLDHGAKTDEAMNVALANRQAKVVKVLWDRGVRTISELSYDVSQRAPIGDVQKLLDSGVVADPPEDAKSFFSPLTIAAQLGEMDAVKLLVARGANVNKGAVPHPKSPDDVISPLAMAASEGQVEAVPFLLDHGATPSVAALWEATENGTPYDDQRPMADFEKCLRILIDAGALKGATPEEQGYVLDAGMETRQGPANTIVLKMLLDAGMRPDAPMPYIVDKGEKPNSVIGYYRDFYTKHKDDPVYGSMAATMKPLLDMLEAADKSAASSAVPNAGNTTLGPSATLSLALLPVQAPATNDAPLSAGSQQSTYSGGTLVVSQKRNPLLDPELIDAMRDGRTDKVGAGDVDQAGRLLAGGADPNAKDKDGNSALTWALNFGKDYAAQLLVKNGADGRAQDASGENAAWAAAKIYYCPGALQLLIAEGVDVRGVNKQGQTILVAMMHVRRAQAGRMNYLNDRAWTDDEFKAYEAREKRVMELLIRAGADVKGTDGATTPLMAAVQSGHAELARILLEHGADRSFKDADGHTALDLAKAFHPELAPLLDVSR